MRHGRNKWGNNRMEVLRENKHVAECMANERSKQSKALMERVSKGERE